MTPRSAERVCVLGAGAAGIAAARALLREDIEFDLLDAAEEVGGLWNFRRPQGRVNPHTRLISSKDLQAFSDQPMPSSYEDYPDHRDVTAYLQNYSHSHGLDSHIQYGVRIDRVDPVADGFLLKAGSRTLQYKAVIVATGVHRIPFIPSHAGNFSGQLLHSKDYLDPAMLQGRRVLVVGAGQSAIDVACDAATRADAVYHSTRRGFICLPRYLLGRPTEAVLQRNTPIMARMNAPFLVRTVCKTAQIAYDIRGVNRGEPGLQSPDMSKTVPVPIIGNDIYTHYREKRIVHKPDVTAFHGNHVEFADGSSAAVDLVVYATGYRLDYEFIAPDLLGWRRDWDAPQLFAHIFPKERDNLFVVGMVHPIGAHWKVYDTVGEPETPSSRKVSPPGAACDQASVGPRDAMSSSGSDLILILLDPVSDEWSRQQWQLVHANAENVATRAHTRPGRRSARVAQATAGAYAICR